MGNTGTSSGYLGAKQFGDTILLSGGSIVSVDPATGTRTVIADDTHGTGPAIDSEGFAIAGTSLYVASGNQILNVDTLTGNRTVVSSSTVGTGPSLSTPVDVAIDRDGSLLVPTAPFTNTILRVDPITGDRTVVTSPTVGTGPSLGPLGGQLAIGSNGILYTSEADLTPSQDPVLGVDPTTGNRFIVSDATHGNGPLFDTSGAAQSCPRPSPRPSSSPRSVGWRLRSSVRCASVADAACIAKSQSASLPGDSALRSKSGQP